MWSRFLFLFLLPCLISAQRSCIERVEQIYEKEALVTNTTIPRLYIVCPRATFVMGTLDFDGKVVQPKRGPPIYSRPLPLRPNLELRCGDNGSRDNLCTIKGGDLHLDGTRILGLSDATLENVAVQGFVFEGAMEHALLADKPGSITFADCVFRNFANASVPVLLDYYDASQPSRKLEVTFEGCSFQDNRYFGFTSYSALIYGNTDQTQITIRDTLFENNDMVWNNTRADTHSYLIETLGSLDMDRACFRNNLVGTSNVVVFGSSLQSLQTGLSNSTGGVCGFAAVFETVEQFRDFKPTCIDDAFFAPCGDGYVYSSAPPTPSPTATPTVAPSASPTASRMPSLAPTAASQPTAPFWSQAGWLFPAEPDAASPEGDSHSFPADEASVQQETTSEVSVVPNSGWNLRRLWWSGNNP